MSRSPARGRLYRRDTPAAVRAGLLLAVVLVVAFTVRLLVADGRRSAFWDDGVYSAVYLVAALLCAARASSRPHGRVGWALMAAALTATNVGNVTWGVLAAGGTPSFPSLADAPWVAYYPLAYLAIVLLMGPQLRRLRAGAGLDGLVSGLGVGSVVAALAFDRIVDGTGGGHWAIATTLAYPIGDLLLLVLVAGVLGATSFRASATWMALGSGLCIWVVVDTIYLSRVANGTYVQGTLLDAGWPLGALLAGWAAWLPERSTTRSSATGWATLWVPAGTALLALGVLVTCALGGPNRVAVIMAALAICVALARSALTVREILRFAETRRQALTDELTGLLNRRGLFQRIEAEVGGPRRPTGALLLIDLDRFKELNDTLGHHMGDLLLERIGPRLRTALGPEDQLARLGGDEFAVLLRAPADAAGAEAAGRRVLGSLDEPFVLDDIPVHVDASVGAALLGDGSVGTTEVLLQHADIAMYEAKRERLGVAVYAARRDAHSRDRLAMVAELRAGLGRGELEVHYQPLVDMQTNALVGAEALVRWRHPQHGLLTPGAFLPAIEQTSVARALTQVVLGDALRQAAAWRDAGMALRMSVNIGAADLLDVDFPRKVAERLADTGVDPADVCLEITEDTVMFEHDRASRVLGRLHDLGVDLSLDDFGTGRSSLARLKSMPVDELKVDRAFVSHGQQDPYDLAVIHSAVALGESLDCRVVTEGIETSEAWMALRDAGSHTAQGFLLSSPLPADAFARWAQRWEARTHDWMPERRGARPPAAATSGAGPAHRPALVER